VEVVVEHSFVTAAIGLFARLQRQMETWGRDFEVVETIR
jgi:hypothetical protein